MSLQSKCRLGRWFVFCAAQCALFMGGLSCLGPVADWAGPDTRRRSRAQDQLKASEITATLNEKIAPARNLIWCATFQLAWNECIRLTGGPVVLDSQPALARELNEQEFTGEWVDASNCVAIADLVENGVYDRIERALRAIVTPADYARYRPERSLAVRPQDLVAYAYLQADLKFASPFEKLENKLVFQGVSVPAFGIGEEYKPGHAELYSQLWVHDYVNPDDFVVELRCRERGDRLILAKVVPEATLLGTVRRVEQRLVPMQAPPKIGNLSEADGQRDQQHLAHPGDVLMVPKMAFDLDRHYHELMGHRLRPARQDIAQDLVILGAKQAILFKMDEKGVKLRSAAQLSFGCSASVRPPPDRRMVFDGPFLLLLQREGAALPYLAIWVANPELLGGE